jgi:glycosyltransferase involved in cell wall biosynthesis
MRVLCVIDSLGSGGAQRQFVNIANGLARQHDVEVLLYNPGSDFYKGDLNTNIPIHRIERPAGARGFRMDVVLRLIRHARQSDAIISFLPTANIYCAIAAAFSSQVRHVSCEMSVVNETEGRLRRGLADLANRRSDHVICNSFTQADYIAGRPGMGGKVSTVWNGCAELDFAERDLSARSIYDFLVVARVAFPKNGVRLVEALEIFRSRNGYVPRVAWAGRDDLDDRARQMKVQMLDFLAAHPQVQDNFTWLGEVSNVESLYEQAGALLSVSTYEGVPVVICEAMFSGCPVVASQISDNAIILGDGARGFLCDPLSPEDICLALERRLNASPADLQSMIEGARTYAMENFSISKMVEGYDRVLAKLAKTA